MDVSEASGSPSNPVPVDLRCSAQAHALGLDPAGTAVSASALLLVELPLPWPKDVAAHPAMESLRGVAGLADARIQAVVPDPDRAARGETEMMLHRQPSGPFTAYERRSSLSTDGDWASQAKGLLALQPEPAGASDVLICGHGSRDRCCGSLGTALETKARVQTGVRLWRTSHLGGHRFAPTALLLPSGTAWAWLDEALLDRIVNRAVPPAELRSHYRGSTAMGHPALQLLEAEAFARVGWPWLDHARAGTVSAEGEGRWRVCIESGAGTWSGVVERLGRTPQPVCGSALSDAFKQDDLLRLDRVVESA